MNCRQAENLLPLHVSHDLAEKQARSLAEHLQNCAACARVLDEQWQAQELLQEFVPRSLSEADYDALRQNVWRQIESESTRPAFTQLVSGWFSLPVAWAAAAVLIVAVIGGIYLFRNRNTERREVAFQTPRVDYPPVPSPPAPASDKPDKRQTYLPKRSRRVITSWPQVRNDEAASVASIALPPAPVTAGERTLAGTQDLRKTTRVEIQTRDPNIRIIWFAQ